MEENRLAQKLYSKAHHLLFWGHVFTTFFLIVGCISQMHFAELEPYRSIVPSVAGVIVLLVAIVLFIKYRDNFCIRDLWRMVLLLYMR